MLVNLSAVRSLGHLEPRLGDTWGVCLGQILRWNHNRTNVTFVNNSKQSHYLYDIPSK